jgi:hypothetical protein
MAQATQSKYDKQAAQFLEKTNAAITIVYKGKQKHFQEDTEERDVYSVTIARGNRKYTFEFGDSLENTAKREMLALFGSWKKAQLETFWGYDNENARKIYDMAKNAIQLYGRTTQHGALVAAYDFAHDWKEPSDYSVLACLQKYDCGTLEDFCSEFGYDTDSIRARKTYEAVRDEYLNLAKLFSDEELKEMAEIQ